MSSNSRLQLRILGTRGIPARHGGFETFAEKLALYLTARGWHVTVYCQQQGRGPLVEDRWQGVHRVHVPSGPDTTWATVVFDWKATRHASRSAGLCLTLGYNTALFNALLRLKGIPNVINMDGIEYARAKWGLLARMWLRLNEWAACRVANHLIADHPEILAHLNDKAPPDKISVIAYGADALADVSDEPVRMLGLTPERYLSAIARPEPENSLLEIVRGFSSKPRGVQLAVLGQYDDNNDYHRAVRASASPEVVFLGSIYENTVLQALRYHCLAHLHGHQVGGSNPSLIEALAAGNAIIAHDNRFNRSVAGENSCFFGSASDVDREIDRVLGDSELVIAMRKSSAARFSFNFEWMSVLGDYENLLLRHVGTDSLSPSKLFLMSSHPSSDA